MNIGLSGVKRCFGFYLFSDRRNFSCTGKNIYCRKKHKRCEKEKTGWDSMLENFGRVYIKGIDRGVKFGQAQGTFFQWIKRKGGGYGWIY